MLLAAGPAWAETPATHRTDLHLHLDKGVLKGRGVLRIKNTGRRAISTLPVVLYPARFRKLDPAINDVNFDRYYVRWFRPGDMRIDSARTVDGKPLKVAPAHKEAKLPRGTVVRITLPKPVQPGAWAELALAFTVRIPERLGTFGQRSRRVTLEGGALPYVPMQIGGRFDPRSPPPRTRFDLSLRVFFAPGEPPPGALVGARPLSEARGPGRRIKLVARSPFLAAGSDLAPLGDWKGSPALPRVRVFGEEGDTDRAKRLFETVRKVVRLLRKKKLWPQGAPLAPLTFVAAPLRDRFVHVTEREILFSDRLFHVFFLLKGFHELDVARAVVLSLVRQHLARVRLGRDRGWVCEAVAWLVTRELVADEGGIKGWHIRTTLEWLSFIPTLDRILRSPRFTGSDLFYGHFYEPSDSVPDSFQRALTRRARGRVVAEKLRDTLGEKKLWQLIKGVLGLRPWVQGKRVRGRGDVRRQAEQLTGSDLRLFFRLWLDSFRTPRQNLWIKGVKTLEEHADGSADLEVTIQRDGDARIGKVGEPVVLEGNGADGKPVRVVWGGRGMSGRVVLRHDGGLFSPLVVDPDHRIHQTTHGDDKKPAFPFKIMLNRFRIKVDLNQGNRNELAIGSTLHPFHNYAHAIRLDGFYEQDERGVVFGYGYGFGKRLDARTFGTGISGRVLVAKLTEGVLKSDATTVETEGNLVSFGMGFGLDTKIHKANPTWGLDFGLGVEFSDKIFGTDFRFTVYGGELSFIYSIVRGTQLGVEFGLGQITGTDIPSQRLFDAGGSSTVRGVESSTFVGKAQIVVRTEVRQMLIEDMDLSILWLSWLRKLQVVAFLDAGDVGDTISKVWRERDDWKVGAGGGVRLWIDAFGVRNVTFRFDVGVRVDDTDDLDPEFYIGAGQSF